MLLTVMEYLHFWMIIIKINNNYNNNKMET